MLEPDNNSDRRVQVESSRLSTTNGANDEKNDDTVVVNEKQDPNIHEDQDSSSSLDKSFEVLSTICKTAIMDTNEDNNVENEDISSQRTENDSTKSRSRSSSEVQRDSLRERIKKSGSFLSKLQPSSGADNNENSNLNLSSSLASAFSSFSSFTSNFNLGANGNGNNNASGLAIETASTSTKLSQITETKEDVFAKKAASERKNLINLTKLIVKDLISSSLAAGRTIDDCQNAVHLNNYFTLIDRVLKHGLKQNLLSNKSASLWTALDNLPKYLKESTLMSESVRSLTHTKTPDGKIKAWIRLAMMQKKLPEYFNELLANKNILLKDVYHDYAFMLNDEAQVFAGLIIGVNVIDCNFFVKDANFDLMDEIIDLSPYLRAANSFDEDRNCVIDDQVDDEAKGLENLTKVLDQKNYLEEWNKRLESTIVDLRTKIKNLEEQNIKLEMETKVNEVRIQKLIRGNRSETPLSDKQTTGVIKSFISSSSESKLTANSSNQTVTLQNDVRQSSTNDVSGDLVENLSETRTEDSNDKETTEVSRVDDESILAKANVLDQKHAHIVEIRKFQNWNSELKKELSNVRERVGILETSYRGALEKIKVLERDLDIQTSMNSDKETTIKIYEKDIREKQAQVESLRASLSDAKKLNSDLSERLNDTCAKLKDRIKSVSNLQTSLDKWKLENKTLAGCLQDKQTALMSVNNELEKSLKTIEDLKKYNEKINDELRKERECGHSSSVTVEAQNAKIAELTDKLAAIEIELNEARPYREQAEKFKKQCQEYEQSLEEVGAQLRESRLEAESLKENSSVFLDSQWMDSKQVKNCALCQQSFSVTRRKHHCRLCGNVFCQTCSDNKMELASSAKPVRVCDTCHAFLLAKFVKSSSSS